MNWVTQFEMNIFDFLKNVHLEIFQVFFSGLIELSCVIFVLISVLESSDSKRTRGHLTMYGIEFSRRNGATYNYSL